MHPASPEMVPGGYRDEALRALVHQVEFDAIRDAVEGIRPWYPSTHRGSKSIIPL